MAQSTTDGSEKRPQPLKVGTRLGQTFEPDIRERASEDWGPGSVRCWGVKHFVERRRPCSTGIAERCLPGATGWSSFPANGGERAIYPKSKPRSTRAAPRAGGWSAHHHERQRGLRHRHLLGYYPREVVGEAPRTNELRKALALKGPEPLCSRTLLCYARLELEACGKEAPPGGYDASAYRPGLPAPQTTYAAPVSEDAHLLRMVVLAPRSRSCLSTHQSLPPTPTTVCRTTPRRRYIFYEFRENSRARPRTKMAQSV